jgi:putative spermidine/putrescine transport system permease protein
MLSNLRDNYLWYIFLGIGVFACIFLALPTIIVIVNSFNSASIMSFPPRGFSLRWYEAIFRNAQMLNAIRTSLISASFVTLIDLAIGIPAALALVRGRFRERGLLMSFSLSPLMIPHLVIGLALLSYFARVGAPLGMPTLILGHIVISVPFVIRIVGGGAARLDKSHEEAAANLGASPWQVFWRVTLPALTPSIAAGAAFAFLASFDNLEISLFIASGRIQTLPVRMFSLLIFDIDPIVGAVATVQIAFAILLIFILDRLLGLSRVGETSKI